MSLVLQVNSSRGKDTTFRAPNKSVTTVSKPNAESSIPQNVNTVSIQVPNESTTLAQSTPPNTWISIKEILIAYAWPLVVIIVVLLFYRHISAILRHLAEYIKNLDEVSFRDWKFKSKQGESRVASQPPPENVVLPNDAVPQPADLSKMTGKILATLWKYQKAFDDFSKRWTFTIGAFTPEYTKFSEAMRELASRGLVVQDPKTMQFFLTDIGILYCKQNEQKLTEEPFEFK